MKARSGTEKPERVTRRILEWDDWLPSRAGAVATHPTLATDPAFFLYTSGSGGAPKAVVHRHQDMAVAARNYAQGVLGLRADDRLFSVSKLFFAYGLGNGMYFPLHFGAEHDFVSRPAAPGRNSRANQGAPADGVLFRAHFLRVVVTGI